MFRKTLTRLFFCVAMGTLTVGMAHAAISDCPGFPSDGVDNGTETRCVKPVPQPTKITACPEVGTFTSWANAQNACSVELGNTTGYFSSDAGAIAYTNCVNKKIASQSPDVTGAIPWLPIGTFRSSYLCGDSTVSSENGIEYVGASDHLPTYTANWVYGRTSPQVCESDQFVKIVKGPTTAQTSICKPRCPEGYKSLIYGGYYQCYKKVIKIEGCTSGMCPKTP